jgi:hypothetical protein
MKGFEIKIDQPNLVMGSDDEERAIAEIMQIKKRHSNQHKMWKENEQKNKKDFLNAFGGPQGR